MDAAHVGHDMLVFCHPSEAMHSVVYVCEVCMVSFVIRWTQCLTLVIRNLTYTTHQGGLGC